MAASLDHAMWFHRPFRADEWLLYEMESPAGTRLVRPCARSASVPVPALRPLGIRSTSARPHAHRDDRTALALACALRLAFSVSVPYAACPMSALQCALHPLCIRSVSETPLCRPYLSPCCHPRSLQRARLGLRQAVQPARRAGRHRRPGPLPVRSMSVPCPSHVRYMPVPCLLCVRSLSVNASSRPQALSLPPPSRSLLCARGLSRPARSACIQSDLFESPVRSPTFASGAYPAGAARRSKAAGNAGFRPKRCPPPGPPCARERLCHGPRW